MSVRQIGQPHGTLMTHVSQKRWWPHGRSAIRASCYATMQTSQSLLSVAGVTTVATTAIDSSIIIRAGWAVIAPVLHGCASSITV